MKNELKLIEDVYDRMVLKIDNFGGIKKEVIAKMLFILIFTLKDLNQLPMQKVM